MKEFIINLYANENFPVYLSCVIIVLLIAFFVVFFLGKRDKKKIEMTQKLEQINADAFKEVSVPQAVASFQNPAPVQVPPVQTTEPVMQASPSVTESTIQYFDTPVQEPVVPVQQVQKPLIPTPVVEIPAPVIESAPQAPIVSETVAPIVTEPHNTYVAMPTVEPVVEQPVITPEPNIANFENLANSIASELEELERQQQIAQPLYNATTPVEPVTVVEPAMPMPQVSQPIVEIPVIEPVQPVVMPVVDEIVVPVLEEPKKEELAIATPNSEPTQTKILNDVFSSVYVPKKDTSSIFDETMAIELPRLKDAPTLEQSEDNRLYR